MATTTRGQIPAVLVPTAIPLPTFKAGFPAPASADTSILQNNGNFSDTTLGTFGTCPAQLVVAWSWYDNWDLSLQKNVQITERYKVQFRTDFVNAFNHVNLNAPEHGIRRDYGADN